MVSHNQTRAIRNSSDVLNENLQKCIKEGIQVLDEISNSKNKLLQGRVNSNQVDSSNIKTIANLLSEKTLVNSF